MGNGNKLVILCHNNTTNSCLIQMISLNFNPCLWRVVGVCIYVLLSHMNCVHIGEFNDVHHSSQGEALQKSENGVFIRHYWDGFALLITGVSSKDTSNEAVKEDKHQDNSSNPSRPYYWSHFCMGVS